MITYFKHKSGRTLLVYLEGKRIGVIHALISGGYQYFPNGQRKGGDKFPDLGSCKKSLEAK